MSKLKKRLLIALIIFLSVILVFIAVFFILCAVYCDNKTMDFDYYTIEHDKPPLNIKIAQLSDMHFPNLEVDLSLLLEKLNAEKVDLIALTGDLIDENADIDTCGVKDFIVKLNFIAPIYYVNGNHDSLQHEGLQQLHNYLTATGVIILNNKSVNTAVNGKNITIMGLCDNTSYDSALFFSETEKNDDFKLLLAHRPEKWKSYISDSNSKRPDLVLSGHAHGGQIRIFDKGILAPNQGFFPKYDSGLYNDNGVNMIVSRGIGNSSFPYRVNNDPHIPIITI